jgi:conjugal transfer/type IV secretion protein DotA/TraY
VGHRRADRQEAQSRRGIASSLQGLNPSEDVMRRFPIVLLIFLLFAGIWGPASAQQPAPPAGTSPAGANVSWSALDPGNDFAAQAIESVFPVLGSPPTSTGQEATVIGQIVAQLTGFVMALAMAFVCYNCVMHIHRVAETSNLLGRGMTSMGLVRIGFGAVMMFPLNSGFSTGQAVVVQASMWGIGMAKAVYSNAVQAIGPDAVVLAQPMIPGTKTIVLNLVQDEMCAALVNVASGNPNLVPVPNAIQSTPNPGGLPGGYVTWSYSLSPGNETGSPVCGTVTIQEPNQNATNLAGVSLDMTSAQRSILTQVLTADIRPTVQQVATNFWQTKQASALTPLQSVFQQATADYTNLLTQQATTITSQLRSALQASQLRAGQVGLAQNENQLAALGWSAAGSYFLEIARLNGSTLSLLSATPEVNVPSYEGLSPSLKADLAPLSQSETAFLAKLNTYVQTADGMNTPGGNAELFSGATPGEDGAGVIEQVFRALHINERLLNLMTSAIAPSGNQWNDPFGGLMQLGHGMIIAALGVLGTAGLLSSSTGTTAATIFNVLTGDVPGAALTVIVHFLMQFLWAPIMAGAMALLLPGLTIAFVLPMIPWVMWMAGVAGYLILVCEAVVAVPLWMLAHMTMEGDGLHGRAMHGYALIFDVLFRPTLMLLGLFLGYFVFTAMSFLIRESFGIAASLTLENGWLVTNFLGIMVLISIFVLAHVVAALLSFRMIALIPHHLPKLIGFAAGNRVDIDQFARDTALVGAAGAIRLVSNTTRGGLAGPMQRVEGPNQKLLGASQSGTEIDSTLQAETEISRPPSDEGEELDRE